MPGDDSKRRRAVKLRAVIDRLEDDDTAVLYVGDDERAQVDLPASLLPRGAEGGDHLLITIEVTPESRGAAEERIKALQQRLLRRSNNSEGK